MLSDSIGYDDSFVTKVIVCSLLKYCTNGFWGGGECHEPEPEMWKKKLIWKFWKRSKYFSLGVNFLNAIFHFFLPGISIYYPLPYLRFWEKYFDVSENFQFLFSCRSWDSTKFSKSFLPLAISPPPLLLRSGEIHFLPLSPGFFNLYRVSKGSVHTLPCLIVGEG